MIGQPARNTQFGVSFPRSIDGMVAGLRGAAKTLLAHVREMFTCDSHAADDVAGMNAHMLRDIGAEPPISSRPAGRPDLQYPRL